MPIPSVAGAVPLPPFGHNASLRDRVYHVFRTVCHQHGIGVEETVPVNWQSGHPLWFRIALGMDLKQNITEEDLLPHLNNLRSHISDTIVANGATVRAACHIQVVEGVTAPAHAISLSDGSVVQLPAYSATQLKLTFYLTNDA